MALQGRSKAPALLLLALAVLFQTISAQDEVEVGFENSQVQVFETMGYIMETVSVNRNLTEGEFITLMVMDPTGNDISVSPTMLYFNESISTQTLTITIIDDTYLEGNETVTIMIVVVEEESNVTVANSSSVIMLDVLILDDEREVTLDVPSPTVAEDVGSVRVCARTSPAAIADVTVYISTVEGTATSSAPMDYVGLSDVPLTIATGSTYNCTYVDIYNDTLVEDDEYFYVVMTTTDVRVTISTNMTRITIMSDPDDSVNATLSSSLTYVSESLGNFTLNVSVTPNFERPVNVTLNVVRVENAAVVTPTQVSFQDPMSGGVTSNQISMDITFMPGSDPSTSVTVFFTGGPCVQTTIQTLDVNLSTSDPAVMLATPPSDIMIIDDSTLTIGFNTTISTVNEGTVAMVPIAILGGCVGTSVTVTVSLTPAMMDVLSLSSMSVTFDINDTVRYVNLTAPSDDILEYDVDFMLQISNPLPTQLANYITLSPDTLNITALDNPAAVVVGFTMPYYNVSEGSSLEVCVGVVTGSLQREVEVRVSVTNGTAYEGVDFTGPSTDTVTLNSSAPSSCVTVYTSSNGVVEENKMFSVGVALVQPVGVSVMPREANVSIMESDSVTIGFTETNIAVTEGMSFRVCVQLTNGSLNRDVVVVIASMNGTAGSIADFSPIDERVTFNSAQSRRCVNVDTLTDNLTDEDSEEFTVNLTPLYLSPPIVMLTPATATITINDAPFISQHPMDQYVLEGDDATFTVVVNGGNLMYQWVGDGDMLMDSAGEVSGSSTPSVTVYNVTSEDLGDYYCIISNMAANVTSNNATLSFVPMPMNLQAPGNTGVLVNGTLTLTCSVESRGEAANITWSAIASDGGQMITLPEAESVVTDFVTASNITIEDIDESYAGNYTCMATNRASTVQQTFTVSVITVIGVNDVIAFPGQNVTFFCDASGDPDLMYRWSIVRGGGISRSTNPTTRLPNSFADGRVIGIGTSSLTILQVSFNDILDDMMIACTVSLFDSELDTVFGQFEVQQVNITEQPVDQTVEQGGNATLSCTATNIPDSPFPLQFTWMVNTSNVTSAQRISITQTQPDSEGMVTSYLIIRNTVFTDNGRYRCRVSVFRPQDVVESDTAVLTIQFAPVVTSIIIEVPSFNGFLDPLEDGTYRADALSFGNRMVAAPIAEPVVTIDGVRLYQLGSAGNPRERIDNCSVDSVNLVVCFLPVLGVSAVDVMFDLVLNNSVGMGNRMFRVRYQSVPDPVDLAMLTSRVINLVQISLTWTRPGNNNADIRSYTVSFCHIVSGVSCTVDTNIELLANSTDLTTGMRGTANANRITYNLVHRADLNSSINVTVTATNRVGDGGFSNGPATVPVATIVDATPTNIRTTALSNRFAVVVWELPATAMGDGIMVSGYTVDVDFPGAVNGFNSTNTSSNTLAVLVSPSMYPRFQASGRFVVTVTTLYTTPDVSGATSMEFIVNIPAADAEDVAVLPGAMVMPNPTSATTATVSWQLPDNRDFLDMIQVTYISTPIIQVSSRKRRAANVVETMILPNTATSAMIPTEPFSNVNTGVNAVYEGGLNVPLVMSATFQSPESKPTMPRNLQVMTNGVHSLRCEWLHPDPTNGLIVRYILVYYESSLLPNQADTITLLNNDTSAIITGLDAFTRYVVRVRAVNRAPAPNSESDPSDSQTGMTGFGVAQPVTVTILPSTTSNGEFSVQFTVSRSEGQIGQFQIIISTTRLTDSTSMSNIGPYSSGSTIYVTRVGPQDTSEDTTMVFIGTEEVTTSGSTNYIDQRLNGNTDYYVIVRLFSSIDATVFNDSAISSPINFRPGLNTVAVIAPIAAIAGILIIVLIILLVVAYCTMASPFKRFGGYAVAHNVERRQGGKGAGIEMRRTRMFSPVLNVGTSDVFTSANQPTTLICEASGTPAPTVSWTRNGEALDKERFIQLADGSLFINDTDLQDEGSYVVKAVNSAGEAEEMVRMTVLRPVPPENDAEHPPIKVGEFSEKIALVRAEDDEGLEDEYTEVELDWTFTSYSAKLNINKNKNRYINIIPYDHSRVVLSLQDSTPGSDYINASFIDAYQRPNGYIASQGPIPSTFPDFWRMIWELDSPTIVMVTNLKEEDKIKCHQYWPSYGTTTYGNIQVTLKEVENLAEYSIRTFNVSPLAGQSRVQMPVREVRQFHFLVWPDHGVPTYATNLLSFRKRILKYHPEKRGPMTVHCSAGVGRTGTFITIDFMLKQMEAEGSINIFNFVRHMRYRRNYMVQTSPQYVFIHDALLESIMCGDNSIKAPELKKKVEELRQIVPETGVSTFETQFNTLKTASPPDEDFDCSIARLPDNEPKNRSKANLPSNDFRVVLSSEKEQSDYICASYVDNYRERNAFIVTQGPLEETAKDFWRMMWETKSAAIVMLTELKEEGQEMCVKYWPSSKGEPDVYGDYQVQLSEDEKDRGDYITRRFKLSPVDNPQESRMVSQFHFIRWSKTLPPKDCRPMIDLIEELQRVQRKSGNMPITVHCDDGIGRTGAFCTLYSVLERVKTEQIVDVFQAVKTLRIQRTGLLATISGYEFVHHAVIEFLETFSEYQNFK